MTQAHENNNEAGSTKEVSMEDLITSNKALLDRVEKAEASAKEYDEHRETIITKGYSPTGATMNSDEQRALRYFRVSHVKDLLQVNTCDPVFARVPENLKYLVQSLKADFDVARLIQQVVHGEPVDRESRNEKGDATPSAVKGILDGNYFGKNVLAPRLKAFGTSVSTEGAEWVPVGLSSSYIEEFQLDRQVAALFKSFTMPNGTFELPVQESTTIARIQAEGSTIAQANFNTSKLTFSAVKLAEYTVLTEELNEDSAPSILTLARNEVVQASARAIETAIINGDTTGSHQDSDVTAATDARKAWKGLRKLALANSATIDFTNAAATVTKLRSMRTLMGKYGVEVRDLAWLVTPKVYAQMINLPEVTTVDKLGPQATIRTGVLDQLDGVPIIVSEFGRDDLNASGVYDASVVNRSGILLVKLSRFYLGVRRPIKVRAVQDPTPPNDRWLLASWWRGDFKGNVQDSNEKSVVYGINIA